MKISIGGSGRTIEYYELLAPSLIIHETPSFY